MYKDKYNLHLEIQTPFELNFLIYIQNCYLNNTVNYELPKFPYIPIENGYHEKFKTRFNAVWDEILLKYNRQDKTTINENSQLLAQSLFTKQEVFNYLYQSFSAWWKGLAGQMAIQNFFSNEKINKLYANMLETYQVDGNDSKYITIYLIYDNCQLLSPEKKYEDQVVLSLEDIMRKNLVGKFKHQF
ncbi:hypothetical protein ACTNDN_20770 [Niallia sp. HCP3S3_B10]|uniref:hypothetical protein n=1 Tax=Niallia sp. HCP3S3_B10 TaxID=3438944 RepID=UPI003F8B2476